MPLSLLLLLLLVSHATSCLFPDHESPESLYQHYARLRAPGSLEALPLLPPGLDADAAAVVHACLQVCCYSDPEHGVLWGSKS